jgi:hypothetical protein
MNKNIHVLPTNKPTGIFELKNGLHFSIIKKIRYGEFKGFHIYITSDEEIKEGDWFLFKIVGAPFDYRIHYCKDITDEGYVVSERELNCDLLDCKKIILTTDQDLIADGVQSIDDEFLEWFVKNPSCERIVFEKIQYNPVFDEDDLSYDGMTAYYNYKIIIPQEEPKQETLEEAAKEYDRKSTRWGAKNIFIDGAKWQAERMYSEDEVLNILYQWSMYKIDIELERLADELPNILPYNEWFEQFKKKQS